MQQRYRRGGSSVAQHSFNLKKFRGVDFASDPSQVNNSRSPDAVNMISDMGGFPCKRHGYKAVLAAGASIHGIYRLVTPSGYARLVHAGTGIYTWDGDDGLVQIADVTMADAPSCAFQMSGYLWILDGTTFRRYDGTSIVNVSDIATVPVTSIGCAPSGGGTSHQDVNMLSAYRMNEFLGTASDTVYHVDMQPDAGSTFQVWKMDANGVFQEMTTGWTGNAAAGTVTFSVAPGTPPAAFAGQDNIRIKFKRTVQADIDKINKCRIFATYGVDGREDRIFLSGNPDHPNMDWYSDIYDPSYVGSKTYKEVGSDACAIMGYRKVGKYLSIHKQENGYDSAVFLRAGTADSTGKETFQVEQGIAGVGAISRLAFVTLSDDPMFLTRMGMMAITSNDVTGERYAQGRSFYVDPRLLKEEGLENAVATAFGYNLFVAVNGHVYVADGRQRADEQNAFTNSFQYEWYYWEDVPITASTAEGAKALLTVWYVEDNKLFFGTSEGYIMQFYDRDSLVGWTDENGLLHDEEQDGVTVQVPDQFPVKAHWDTPIMDMGSMTNLKTLQGVWVMINPYPKSSITIYYKLKSLLRKAKEGTVDFIDFGDIDFSRFVFDTDSSPKIVVSNAKQKKFSLIQFRLSNEKDEAFGVFSVSGIYFIGGQIK